MKGTAEQLQYIMRDEVLHCALRHPGGAPAAAGREPDPGPGPGQGPVGRGGSRRVGLRRLHPAGAHPGLQRRPAPGPVPLHRQPPRPPAGAWPSPSPVPRTCCPGSTNRPTCARKRTSSKPASPSTRPAAPWPGTEPGGNQRRSALDAAPAPGGDGAAQDTDFCHRRDWGYDRAPDRLQLRSRLPREPLAVKGVRRQQPPGETGTK